MEDLGIGIYKISMSAFPQTRILYVGQSKYLRERMKTHKSLLAQGKHHNPYLQNVYNKYGFSGWTIEVLENCGIEELDEREQFYIDTLKPECNILRDVRDMHSRVPEKEQPVLVSGDLPGLELDWRPQEWHMYVYGGHKRGEPSYKIATGRPEMPLKTANRVQRGSKQPGPSERSF